jgi:hypothetical protein
VHLDIAGDLLLLLVVDGDVYGHVPGDELHHITKGLNLLAPKDKQGTDSSVLIRIRMKRCEGETIFFGSNTCFQVSAYSSSPLNITFFLKIN